MSRDLDEDFWEDLLVFIEEGKVIPVIGEGIVTFGADDQPLYPWLAVRLAERLSIPLSDISQPITLNSVATAFFMRGRDQPNLLYTRLFRVLKEECPEPGPSLVSLAQISAFDLFISTTVDPLLENALNEARFGGQPCTESVAYSAQDRTDLPVRKRDLEGALVYHLFGRASPQPEYVLWEADILEAVIDLHDNLKRTGTVENLSRDLKEHGVLLLGLSFSDWLVRLFLRITQQDKLSLRVHPAYLADTHGEKASNDLVMFFGAVTRGVHVMQCCPREFTRELSRRWLAKHPVAKNTLPRATPAPVPLEMPRGAIFVSYAREDEEAVRRVVAGLQQAGCTVWYDRERLKAGSYWPNELEDEVKERCGLFLSIISRTTESSFEGYYHRERNWAADRFTGFSHGMAPGEFYVPVVIDDTPLPPRGENRTFTAVQATTLPGGVITEEFGRTVRAMQQKRLNLNPASV